MATPSLSKSSLKRRLVVKEWLTTREAAHILNRQPQTLRKWACLNQPVADRLTRQRSPSGWILWSAAAVQRAIRQGWV